MNGIRSHRSGWSTRRPRRQMSVLQLLEVWVEDEAPLSNVERIRQMREAYFADVDALQKSGRIKLPK